jgi:myo-inositol 2-dehydrogenase/D-chiro-inositol 1-dehydrogenase
MGGPRVREQLPEACALRQRFARQFRGGARYPRGHKALYTLEINAEHASIFWDLHDLHRLQYFNHPPRESCAAGGR